MQTIRAALLSLFRGTGGNEPGGGGGNPGQGGNCGARCNGNAGNCFAEGTVVHTSRGTQAIETIRIGQRVITYLPHERTEPEPEEPTAMEWAAHRVITLLLPCQDEQWIRMQLLRDPDWFRMMAPEVGETIFLDMPEMGVEGDAIVETIEPCPEIEIGEGRVVTATFHHSSGECLELDIEGEDEPLRVTAGHPIWRVDHTEAQRDVLNSTACCSDSSSCECDIAGTSNAMSGLASEIIESLPELPVFESQLVSILESATTTMEFPVELLVLHPNWAVASDLQPGDTVGTAHRAARIGTIRLDQTSRPVFNIEVQGDHVYRVASSAVLVHNDSAGTGGCYYCADRGFHYVKNPPGYPSWTAYVVAVCGGSTDGVSNPHGHHIVMKARFEEYTEPSRQILCKHGINPYFDDCRNLVISPNHCHSLAYAKWVYEQLKEADGRGTGAVEAVLRTAARYHRNCTDPGGVDDDVDE